MRNDFLRLLRVRHERPRRCPAAEKRDELAPFHAPPQNTPYGMRKA
jgi:hypothetical protein